MKYLSKLTLTYLNLPVIILIGLNSVTFAGIGSLLDQPNLYVFSVGVDEYQAPLKNLSAAKNDAIALADEFERRGKDGFGEVKKIVLLDSQATKAAIIRELENLARDISSNDVFIFNFSGLGYSDLSVKLNEFYLFPSGFQTATFEKTGISNSQLQALFRKIRARSKLVILDSCKSADGYESAVNSFIEQDKQVADLNKENVLFIGTDTLSWEKDGHGSITQIILDGLNGNADFNRDGVISSHELEAQVYIGGVGYAVKNYPEFHPRTVTRGSNFKIGFSNERLEKIAQEKKANSSPADDAKKLQPVTLDNKRDETDTRTDILNLDGETEETATERKGADYALLFANDTFDNQAWRTLKNPQNDVNDVAKELKERYGFKEVIIKPNLTTQEIYDTIGAYQKSDFKNFNQGEDQLFIFFAGHGIADKYNKGFYVGRDSLFPKNSADLTRQEEGSLVSLDGILNAIDRIPLEHIMIVFDACYAGQIWKASIQPIQETASLPNKTNYSAMTDFEISPFIRNYGASSKSLNLEENNLFNVQEISKLAYAKRKMKERSRRVLTSGDKPVFDSWKKKDGTRSNNSPFADAFLKALKTSGGGNEVLITAEIVPHIDELPIEPQVGKISGSDGDFVFVKPDKTSVKEK